MRKSLNTNKMRSTYTDLVIKQDKIREIEGYSTAV